MHRTTYNRVMTEKPKVWAILKLVAVPPGYRPELKKGMVFRSHDITSDLFFQEDNESWYRIGWSYFEVIDYRLHMPAINTWISLGDSADAPDLKPLIGSF